MKESVRVLLTEEEVDRKIDELGAQITRDYAGRKLHLVCVLKGGAHTGFSIDNVGKLT